MSMSECQTRGPSAKIDRADYVDDLGLEDDGSRLGASGAGNVSGNEDAVRALLKAQGREDELEFFGLDGSGNGGGVEGSERAETAKKQNCDSGVESGVARSGGTENSKSAENAQSGNNFGAEKQAGVGVEEFDDLGDLDDLDHIGELGEGDMSHYQSSLGRS